MYLSPEGKYSRVKSKSLIKAYNGSATLQQQSLRTTYKPKTHEQLYETEDATTYLTLSVPKQAVDQPFYLNRYDRSFQNSIATSEELMRERRIKELNSTIQTSQATQSQTSLKIQQEAEMQKLCK